MSEYKWLQFERVVEWSSSGDSSSASSSGDSSSASSSGDSSITAATGEFSEITIGKNAIGAATGNRITWHVRKGAVLLCQWTRDGKKFHTKTFDSKRMRVKDGAQIKIEFGKIVKQWSDDLR